VYSCTALKSLPRSKIPAFVFISAMVKNHHSHQCNQYIMSKMTDRRIIPDVEGQV
jgi:hypothetical protein